MKLGEFIMLFALISNDHASESNLIVNIDEDKLRNLGFSYSPSSKPLNISVGNCK